MIVKAIILIISFFLITYRIGIITAKLTKRENILEVFIFGLLTLFALLQIILLPSIVFHVSFKIPYILTCITVVILIIISFILEKPKQEILRWKENIKNIRKQSKVEITLNTIIVFIIVFQAIMSSYLLRENADDSYYVSLATQSIDSSSLYMEDPSLGLEKEYTLFSSFEQISSYELGTHFDSYKQYYPCFQVLL